MVAERVAKFKVDRSVKKTLEFQKFPEDKMVAEVPFLFTGNLK